MQQPYIHRLTHLGVAAVQRGRGLAFLDEVSRMIWGGTTGQPGKQGDHLAQAAARAPLSADMAAGVVEPPIRLVEIVSTELTRVVSAPPATSAMTFNGEPFQGSGPSRTKQQCMEQQGRQRR